MPIREICGRICSATLIATGILTGASSSMAVARDAASMSCGELWHARNAIYARNGYCFQTPRARATFGRGCFPPYGELGGWERDRVNQLQYWERERGC